MDERIGFGHYQSCGDRGSVVTLALGRTKITPFSDFATGLFTPSFDMIQLHSQSREMFVKKIFRLCI